MGIASQAMKLLLALLVVAVATAHWTHDDSLAREIGAPPGQEEDADVVALSDELISESETSGEGKKLYRITIGTAWVPGDESPSKQFSWYNGGSSQPIEFKMKGQKGWSAGSTDDITIVEDGSWAILRYYNGPFMDYDMAGVVAPTLLPGLVPLLTGTRVLCYGRNLPKLGRRVKDCNKKVEGEATEELDWCEPNTKACKSKLQCKESSKNSLDCTGIGYARPPPTKLKMGPEAGSSTLDVGLIQRGQIDYLDVGDILEVQIQSIKVDGCDLGTYECSSPWYPKFIKVNSNAPKSGVGNGIYYIHPMEDLHTGMTKMTSPAGVDSYSKDMYIVAKPGAVPDDATTSDMTASHNAELVKCVAQQCEEEMDAKL